MSVLQVRGGVPWVTREAVTTTGRFYRFPFTTSGVIIRVLDDALRIFLSQAAFDAALAADFFQVEPASPTYPFGEFVAPIEAQGLWLKAAAATANIQIMAFQRRG